MDTQAYGWLGNAQHQCYFYIFNITNTLNRCSKMSHFEQQ